MSAPEDWAEALEALEQLVWESRDRISLIHDRLRGDLTEATNAMSTIRLDAVETATAPHSPDEFARQFAVQVLLAAFPASVGLRIAGTKFLSFASYLVRVSGNLPMSRQAAAGAERIAWNLRIASARLPDLLADLWKGGTGLAKDVGKDVTNTAFAAVAQEVIRTTGADTEGPTGLLAVDFLGQVERSIQRSEKLSLETLAAIRNLGRTLKRRYDADSRPALIGAVRHLTAPAVVEGPFPDDSTRMEAALEVFRTYRDSPNTLKVPRLPLWEAVESPLQQLATAIDAEELTLSARITAIGLALTYEFHKVVRSPAASYVVGGHLISVPAQHRQEYLDVDDKMWTRIFSALRGRARINRERTRRVAEALGTVRRKALRGD